MTQLHHDRLLAEGPVPATGARSPRDAARVPSSRRASDRARQGSPETIPTRRAGDVPLSGTTRIDGATPHELAVVADLAGLTGQAEAAALAGVRGLASAARPAAADADADAEDPASATGGLLRRRLVPPALRRRPAFCLAAALTGAIGLGLVSTGGSAALAGGSEPVSHSVSVAEELGLDAETQSAAAEAEATARLEEMTASRTAREAEQAAAAEVQAEADRLASEAAAAAAAEAARPDAVLPVAGARLTSGFGARWGKVHAGIDLAAPMLTPEYAAMDGVVLEAGPASGYGNVVYVQHENGDVTVYGHMEEIHVTAGQVVRAGDTIALLGNRGQSTGPHLHFEVHVGGIDGEKIDPVPWLQERGVAI